MTKLPQIPGYQVKEKLGQGGMADVYLGIQEKLQRQVAIKVMIPLLFRDEQFSKRFIKEAQTAAQLNHPNIITIHDVGETGDSYYINSGLDRILGSYEGLMDAAVNLYANGEDLSNPLISPVYGDFSGFPPSFLISGTRDLLLSNTIRVDMKLREVGVETKLLVIEGHSHGDYLLVHQAPESQVMFKNLDDFLKKYAK